MLLGALLSFIAHALIEINYLQWAQKNNYQVTFYGTCALYPVIQAALWILGTAGGFFLGNFWWRNVYVERVWIRDNKKQYNYE
ncbi:MAG TPA: hypothetical protein VLK22_00840 [Candidatus Udaeobacter sp.]|nr:hypothetical protein [Candidatus Udaeobacter sp.]